MQHIMVSQASTPSIWSKFKHILQIHKSAQEPEDLSCCCNSVNSTQDSTCDDTQNQEQDAESPADRLGPMS